MKKVNPDQKNSTLTIEQSFALAPDLLSQKQASWKSEGYNDDEIIELTGMLKRLSKISDRLKELSSMGDDSLKSLPELTGEFRELVTEKDNILMRREDLKKLMQIRLGIYSIEPEKKNENLDFKFTVNGAVNPFAAVMKESQFKVPELIAEKKDIDVDLQKILEYIRSSYINEGCHIWAEALKGIKIDDFNLSQQQLKVIKARVKKGEIIIVMPGRQAQLDGLLEAIKQLKPRAREQSLGVRDKYRADEADPTLCSEYVISLIKVMKEIVDLTARTGRLTPEGEVAIKAEIENISDLNSYQEVCDAINELPEQPYLFTVKPTQAPEKRTRQHWINNMIAEYKKIEEENKKLRVGLASIGEYLAMQFFYTDSVQKLATSHNKDKELRFLTGLPGGSVFINLPKSKYDQRIVGKYEDNSHFGLKLEFRTEDGYMDDNTGFRTVVRI